MKKFLVILFGLMSIYLAGQIDIFFGVVTLTIFLALFGIYLKKLYKSTH